MRTVLPLILFWVLLVPTGSVALAQDTSAEHTRPVSEREMTMMLQMRGAFTAPQMADIIRQRGIDFRLTDSMRKEFRKAGASQPVMDALEQAYIQLKTRTSQVQEAAFKASLTPIPAPPPPPIDDEAAKAFVEESRRNALAYSDNMPNYICTQQMKRLYALRSQRDPEGSDYWRTQDTLYVQVSYNDKHENYRVFMWNSKSVDTTLGAMGGATSTGEFVSMLRYVFLPESQAQFRMAAPASLNGRPVYAFDYKVDKEHSQWSLYWEPGHAGERHYTPGYSGRVIIDADTKQVLRVWLVADDIPADFPIHSATSVLNYNWAKIAGVPYLLPASSVMEMTDSQAHTRNETEFRGYRRFSAETKLKFDDVPADFPGPIAEPPGPTKPPTSTTPPKPPDTAPPAKKR